MAEKKIKVGDREFTATPVSFQPADPEKWVRYELGDDSVISAKATVMQIYRLHGEFDPEGNPRYHIEVQIACKTVEVAEHFKRK